MGRHKLLLCLSSVCAGFIFFVCSGFLSVPAYADQLLDAALTVCVDDNDPVTVDAFDADYENNTYVSLRSLAGALSGSQKAFDVSYTYDLVNGVRQNEHLDITTGKDYTGADADHGYVVSASLMQNALVIDGRERRYWTYQHGSEGDLYMGLTDLAMVFDLSLAYEGENTIRIDTQSSWQADLDALNGIHYFDSLSGVYMGDLSTGKVLYAKGSATPRAIASTTKLMTCLLALDAVSEGRASMGDMVVISEYAERISQSVDGHIPLYAGQEILFSDLLCAMMLPSSNEAAIAIAEYLEGSEEAFVVKMNEKASALSLTSAFFYNCTGLPCFPENTVVSKVHNLMSAYDLFHLAQILVTSHPEVLEITSQKAAYLESLGYAVYNTNAMLYNLPGVLGLKSGTTNRAGYCLVTLMEIEADEENHTVVCVLLDAEGRDERNTKTELLLRYAQNYYS